MHLPVSTQPVEATVDCLQGFGDSKMCTHCVIMESLEDERLGVHKSGCTTTQSLFQQKP